MAKELATKITNGQVARMVEGTDALKETVGGTGQTSYNVGDLLLGAATNTLNKLAIGTNGQVLTSNGTTAAWTPNAATDQSTMTNADSTAFVPGNAVYAGATGVLKASAAAFATSVVVGLSLGAIAAAASGLIQTGGAVTLATAQWDAVTGQTGGLTPGARYFLDPTTAGKITSTPPNTTGQQLFKIGHALSATVLVLSFNGPYGL